jgi:hypothetical protein
MNELLQPVLTVNPQLILFKFMQQPNKMFIIQIICAILLLSCQGPPLSIKECPKDDSLCRIQFAMTGWEISTEQGKSLMAYLSNLEQDFIITQYFEKSTSIIPPELCESARNSTTKRRCMDLLHRPHLWEGNRTAQQNGVFRDFPASISDYSSLTPKKDDCVNFGCLDQKAEQAVGQQKIELAAQYCNAIDSKKLMAECYFQIAEKMSVKFGTEFFSSALDICLGAGAYQVNCLEHVIESSINRRMAPQDFPKHIQLVSGLKEFADAKVPSMKGRLVSKYWSSFSYDWMIKNGTIQWIEELPKEARIEWFCTATYFFFSQLSQPIEIKNHLEWIQLIEGNLTKGLTFKPLREPGQPFPGKKPNNTHIIQPNKEYRTLAKHSARIHSEQEALNKSICVVESAFNHQKNYFVEYSDLISSTDPGIQRLLRDIPSPSSKD